MDKRYQVFVSSTYADLQDERREVMQALLELDCIPSGMELFPAANEDQWTLIKKVIDDCDFYIVILGGRYGSLGATGVGFTEMEYRYALEIGRPVLGFLHRNPEALPASRCERSDEGKRRFSSFREFVQKKMCRYWESPADLGSQVSRSMVKLIKSTPAIGWVRGNLVPNESAATEILLLRRRIEELEVDLQSSRINAPEGADTLAQGDEIHEAKYTFLGYKERQYDGTSYSSNVGLSWDDIFSSVSPVMINEANERQLLERINRLIFERSYDQLKKEKALEGLKLTNFEIVHDDFETIKVQLRALGLINRSVRNRSLKDVATYWTLTPYGDTVMTRLRAVRKSH